MFYWVAKMLITQQWMEEAGEEDVYFSVNKTPTTTTTTTTEAPVIDDRLFAFSLPSNPERKHSRGRRNKLYTMCGSDITQYWGTQRVMRENFAQKGVNARAAREKIEHAKKKRFALRGAHFRPGSGKAWHVAKTPEERNKMCLVKRIKAGTNNPRKEKLKRAAWARLDRPAKAQIVQPKNYAAFLGRFRRIGDASGEVCCIQCLKQVNSEKKVLSEPMMRKLIQILLQRGCVEVHPGPTGKGETVRKRRKKIKPGTHLSHRRVCTSPDENMPRNRSKGKEKESDPEDRWSGSEAAVSESDDGARLADVFDECAASGNNTTTTTQTTAPEVIEKRIDEMEDIMSKDDIIEKRAEIDAQRAEQGLETRVMKSARNGVVIRTTTKKGATTLRTVPPKETSDKQNDEDHKRIQVFRGHNLTDEECRHVVTDVFYGDPMSVKRRREDVLGEDQRLCIQGGVKMATKGLEVELVSYVGVHSYLCWGPIPRMLVSCRIGGTWYGAFWMIWYLFKYMPVTALISLTLGYWIFSFFFWVVWLFAAQIVVFQIAALIKSSTLVWGRKQFTYIPHCLSVCLSEAGIRSDTTPEQYQQIILRMACLNIPDKVFTEWTTATIRMAQLVREYEKGFRPVPEDVDFISVSRQLSGVCVSQPSDSFRTRASGGSAYVQQGIWRSLFRSYSDWVQESALPALKGYSQRATDIVSPAWQTLQNQITGIKLRVRRSPRVEVRTSGDYNSALFQDMPQSASIGTISAPSNKDSSSESEEQLGSSRMIRTYRRFKNMRKNLRNRYRRWAHLGSTYTIGSMGSNSTSTEKISIPLRQPEISRPDLAQNWRTLLKDSSKLSSTRSTSTADGSTRE